MFTYDLPIPCLIDRELSVQNGESDDFIHEMYISG